MTHHKLPRHPYEGRIIASISESTSWRLLTTNGECIHFTVTARRLTNSTDSLCYKSAFESHEKITPNKQVNGSSSSLPMLSEVRSGATNFIEAFALEIRYHITVI